jgi:hypothetical protein
MAGDGLEFQVHHVGDVDDEARVLPLDQVHLAYRVGLVLW